LILRRSRLPVRRALTIALNLQTYDIPTFFLTDTFDCVVVFLDAPEFPGKFDRQRRIRMKTLVCTALLLMAAPAAFSQSAHASVKPVTVNLINSQGQSVGTALLSPAPTGVKITLDVKDLPPGEHSIHIHQFAKCDPPDFKSAGAHFDAANHTHGGHPAGDIPDFSLIVAANGTAHVSTVAPYVTLGADDHSVFSNGGTAIIIHAVAGGTGSGAPPRIACGVITKP
jgi:superoxide dismutase, Cu-Zn family